MAKSFGGALMAGDPVVVKKILALDTENLLAREYDNISKKPEVTSKYIRFNGKLEQGHETFFFSRITEIQNYQSDKSMAFSFCKTARKEYDKFVTACLIYAKLIFGNDIRISSDGDIEDNLPALEWAKKYFPEAVMKIMLQDNFI